ncbi:hypothetical protein ACA910_000428 [Epithemia clementina (nom. ined.)]
MLSNTNDNSQSLCVQSLELPRLFSKRALVDTTAAATTRRNVLILGPTSLGYGIGTAALSFPAATTAAVAAAPISASSSSSSSYQPNGLAATLALRDPLQLVNPLFNVPPSVQVYPDWMRGDWQIQNCRLDGYIFPSPNIPRTQLIADVIIPGFQKCSIAQTADVGKEAMAPFLWRIDPQTGWEERSFNFPQTINAYLGYQAVQSVLYDAKRNPNRLSIDFVDYRTVNAERIELFCNARDSESYDMMVTVNDRDENDDRATTTTRRRVFVASEHVKQVTFGTGSTVGVPRQVTTNYGLYWTWQQEVLQPAAFGDSSSNIDPATATTKMKGNLLVAAYLDPQDPLYFQEPNRPVVVYSHVMEAVRPL